MDVELSDYVNKQLKKVDCTMIDLMTAIIMAGGSPDVQRRVQLVREAIEDGDRQ